ncbi:MAG: NUDIX domain-containing protein [Polyangiaceae bacterium]
MSRKTPSPQSPASEREQEYLRDYRASDYPRPSVTVDVVVFTVIDSDLKVLLIKRASPPFTDSWAIPGGFVRVSEGDDQGEGLDEAAARELSEETSLAPGTVFLEQLYTFGTPGRDPRTRVITVAYYALVRPDLVPLVSAGSDAAEARWFSVVEELPSVELAFDHAAILTAAVERIRGKIDYAPLAFELVPPTFTIAELRAVYEAIKGHAYDPGNFRRRFMRMQTDGVIERAPGKRQTGTKPARVYRFAGADRPHPER